jgi:hypothetical protein
MALRLEPDAGGEIGQRRASVAQEGSFARSIRSRVMYACGVSPVAFLNMRAKWYNAHVHGRRQSPHRDWIGHDARRRRP